MDGKGAKGPEKSVEDSAELYVEGDKCPICLVASLNENELTVETKCGHSFCMACILDVFKSSPCQWSAKCPYCRQVMSAFDVLCGSQALCERPHMIFGGVYVQCNTVGLASYHFDEVESYISYSSAPPQWRLDDGTPPPERKPFENSSYDPESRTFRGVINWPITFGEDSKWVYRIVFSEDYMQIDGGEVTAYKAQEEPSDVHVYGQHLIYVRVFHIS